MIEATEKKKLEKTVEFFRAELAKIRVGRATPDILDNVQVDVYDSQTPINHLATISVPDARTIVVQPWDSNTIKSIEKALIRSDLGLNPVVDGELIRLVIPKLTQETREKYVKEMKEKAEEARVAIRQLRQQMMSDLEESKEKNSASEDQLDRAKAEVEDLIKEYIENIDKIAEDKEKELMQL